MYIYTYVGRGKERGRERERVSAWTRGYNYQILLEPATTDDEVKASILA